MKYEIMHYNEIFWNQTLQHTVQHLVNSSGQDSGGVSFQHNTSLLL